MTKKDGFLNDESQVPFKWLIGVLVFCLTCITASASYGFWISGVSNEAHQAFTKAEKIDEKFELIEQDLAEIKGELKQMTRRHR